MLFDVPCILKAHLLSIALTSIFTFFNVIVAVTPGLTLIVLVVEVDPVWVIIYVPLASMVTGPSVRSWVVVVIVSSTKKVDLPPPPQSVRKRSFWAIYHDFSDCKNGLISI